MSAEATAPPRKKKSKLFLLAFCVVFLGSGAAVPFVVPVYAILASGKSEKKSHADAKPITVPFSEVKDVIEKLAKQKAELKSRIIAHIAGKSLKDVAGKVGVTRLQRELHDLFEDVLYPEGHGPIRAVLFEEFVVT